jgi:gliding motility-associated-like protein
VPTRPVIGTVTQPTCVLPTGSVELSGLPSTGNWILRQYPGGIATTGSGTTATITSLNTGTYNFSVENEQGCISPLTDNVVINPQPATPSAPNIGSVTQPTYTVATGSVVLTGLPGGTWTLTRSPDNAEITASGASHTIIGLEPGTYTFTVTNSVGCTSLPSANVVINPRPGTPNLFITNPPTICEDETVDLTLTAVTAGSDADLTFTYWIDLMATEAYATPTAASAGTYYIKGTNAQDFYAIKPVVVNADKIPVADAGLDQVLDYVFGTTLNAEIPEAGAGLWELVTGDGEIFNSTAPSTAVNGLALGENVFSWTVANGACDPVKDYIVVTVNNLIIPTLITPNQDGRNDFFVLRGLTTLGRTELAIFDRRGLKVYENTDYDNTWEGLDYNGYPLPEDTYFYVLRTANGVSRSGYIVVRR